MRALDLVKLKAPPKFAVAKAVTIGICGLIVCYGAFLFCGHFLFFHGANLETQRQQALQGKMTVVTEDGATCYRTLFDNHSSQIVSIEKGPCRNPETSQMEAFRDPDGPLGSIRKALNGR
jgi:hypothetical protein